MKNLTSIQTHLKSSSEVYWFLFYLFAHLNSMDLHLQIMTNGAAIVTLVLFGWVLDLLWSAQRSEHFWRPAWPVNDGVARLEMLLSKGLGMWVPNSSETQNHSGSINFRKFILHNYTHIIRLKYTHLHANRMSLEYIQHILVCLKGTILLSWDSRKSERVPNISLRV